MAKCKALKGSAVKGLKGKGKEVYSYSAILSSISKRSDMDHTVLPANYTMSINQSINHSINQSINQSINWFICMAATSWIETRIQLKLHNTIKQLHRETHW